jgi:hypothetical protein
MRYIYTKEGGILSFVATWMELEKTKLNEIRQVERQHHMVSTHCIRRENRHHYRLGRGGGEGGGGEL